MIDPLSPASILVNIDREHLRNASSTFSPLTALVSKNNNSKIFGQVHYYLPLSCYKSNPSSCMIRTRKRMKAEDPITYK